MILVSVIIPAYNEERYIGTLLKQIRSVPLDTQRFGLEIIVVDDGSRDNTPAIAESFPGVRCLRQRNQGKGAAVQRGVRECTGEYLLVQDADLEYDPADYVAMLDALPAGEWAVVYGSRIQGQVQDHGWGLFPGKHPAQGVGPWAANVLISLWTLMLYRRWISDPLTAYKLYPTKTLRELNVKSTGFEADHEITAKLLRKRVQILEVPIRYSPRSVAQGKKIKAKDGFIALWTLWKYRWAALNQRP